MTPIPARFTFNILRSTAVSRDEISELAPGQGGRAAVDRQTFDRLMLEHLDAAQRLAIRLSGRADIAEEIVQNAMLRASRAWKTYAGRSAFGTWLFQIVIHAFRDDLEQRARRKTAALEIEPPDRQNPDPGALAAAAELGRSVAEAVSNLPPRQREVIVLHTYEQLSDVEIAQVLAVTPQNVRTTLHLARQKLKEQLQPFLKQTDHAR